MENISPNVVIKNVPSNVSSKVTPSTRRPNSPSVGNQRISPAPTTPISVQQNKTMHHHQQPPRS